MKKIEKVFYNGEILMAEDLNEMVDAINEMVPVSGISQVLELIPEEASKTNQLADKAYVDGKSSDPIIITFPASKISTDTLTIGIRGEKMYDIKVENDEENTFYTTIGAELTDTCDTYFAKLKNHMILLDGSSNNYLKPSTVEKTSDNVITITWHAHFFIDRDDEHGADFNVGDCMCRINFKKKIARFLMTQWPDDEMHLIHPIQIGMNTDKISAGTDYEATIIELRERNENSWSPITATKVIEYIKAGYKVEFGIAENVGTEDETFTVGQYDVYYETSTRSKNWLMLRWTNFDKGESSEKSYYFTNTFSVVIFDESGICMTRTRGNTPVLGCAYEYKIFQDTTGDTYIRTYFQKDTLGSKYVLNVNANTRKLSIASETNDGLATAYDVKTYVDSKSGTTGIIKITWEDLTKLISSSALTPGQSYQITDYQCTTTKAGTTSAGHQFDVIVFADSETNLNCKAHAVLHEGDTYFANCDLSKWELWYDINNDTTKYEWADSTNGKGVIYRMIDERNNDCPYDFKNIQFYRSWTASTTAYTVINTTAKGLACYTFSSAGTQGLTSTTDLSVTDETIYNNSFKKYSVNGIMKLNNICFLGPGCDSNQLNFDCYNTTFCYSTANNMFGCDCHDNVINNSSSNNIFGDNCVSNIFDRCCDGNILGNLCSNNKLGYRNKYNSFGVYCQGNTMGYSVNHNTFGDSCGSNTVEGNYNTFGKQCSNNKLSSSNNNVFSDYCTYNTLKSDCNNNNFGSGANNNTFGTYCSYNTIGIDCKYNSFGATTSTTNYYRYITFEAGVCYTILTNSTASSSEYCQNVILHKGIFGTSSSKKTITITDAGQPFTIDIYAAGSINMTV